MVPYSEHGYGLYHKVAHYGPKVTQNNRPLYHKVAHYRQKVAHNNRPLYHKVAHYGQKLAHNFMGHWLSRLASGPPAAGQEMDVELGQEVGLGTQPRLVGSFKHCGTQKRRQSINHAQAPRTEANSILGSHNP